MSVDTTVVIAAYRHDGDTLEYTAKVVQAAENLLEGYSGALESARAVFLSTVTPWFVTLGLAKQYANLLAQNETLKGSLEYKDRPIIEITEDNVYRLSKRGNRLKNQNS